MQEIRRQNWTVAVQSKIRLSLNAPLREKPAAILATSATFVAKDKLPNQLKKGVGHRILRLKLWFHRCFDDELGTIKILKQTIRFICGRYEVGPMWWEDEVNLPNNFHSAMGWLENVERRLKRWWAVVNCLSTNHWGRRHSWINSENWIIWNEQNENHASTVFATISRHQLAWFREGQKKVRHCPQRQTSFWTTTVKVFDWNYFTLPRTSNSAFS